MNVRHKDTDLSDAMQQTLSMVRGYVGACVSVCELAWVQGSTPVDPGQLQRATYTGVLTGVDGYGNNARPGQDLILDLVIFMQEERVLHIENPTYAMIDDCGTLAIISNPAVPSLMVVLKKVPASQ